MVLWLAIAMAPAFAGPRHERRLAEREAQREPPAPVVSDDAARAARHEAMVLLEEIIAQTDDGTLPMLEPMAPTEVLASR